MKITHHVNGTLRIGFISYDGEVKFTIESTRHEATFSMTRKHLQKMKKKISKLLKEHDKINDL